MLLSLLNDQEFLSEVKNNARKKQINEQNLTLFPLETNTGLKNNIGESLSTYSFMSAPSHDQKS